MISVEIYRTPLVNRQLQALRRADKKAAVAAERAENLIEEIAKAGWSELDVSSKLTKHGELRLRNCLKYDLGSGYRLISLKQDEKVMFVFAGTHDDCDRWLNNRRRDNLQLHEDKLQPVEITENAVEPLTLADELLQAEAEYEQRIESKLDEETLRYLFRGLKGNQL